MKSMFNLFRRCDCEFEIIRKTITQSSAGLKLKARNFMFAKQVKYIRHVISETWVKMDAKKVEAVMNRHVISETWVKMDAKKVEAVMKWTEPVNNTQVKSLTGICCFR